MTAPSAIGPPFRCCRLRSVDLRGPLEVGDNRLMCSFLDRVLGGDGLQRRDQILVADRVQVSVVRIAVSWVRQAASILGYDPSIFPGTALMGQGGDVLVWRAAGNEG